MFSIVNNSNMFVAYQNCFLIYWLVRSPSQPLDINIVTFFCNTFNTQSPRILITVKKLLPVNKGFNITISDTRERCRIAQKLNLHPRIHSKTNCAILHHHSGSIREDLRDYRNLFSDINRDKSANKWGWDWNFRDSRAHFKFIFLLKKAVKSQF